MTNEDVDNSNNPPPLSISSDMISDNLTVKVVGENITDSSHSSVTTLVFLAVCQIGAVRAQRLLMPTEGAAWEHMLWEATFRSCPRRLTSQAHCRLHLVLQSES